MKLWTSKLSSITKIFLVWYILSLAFSLPHTSFLLRLPLSARFTFSLVHCPIDLTLLVFRDALTFLVPWVTFISSVSAFFFRHLATLIRVFSFFCWRRHSSILVANSTSFDTFWNNKWWYRNLSFLLSLVIKWISSSVKASTNPKPCYKRCFLYFSNLRSKLLFTPLL